ASTGRDVRKLLGGQKTPPFADAKRRGRNREEADTNAELTPPLIRCQSLFSGNCLNPAFAAFPLNVYKTTDAHNDSFPNSYLGTCISGTPFRHMASTGNRASRTFVPKLLFGNERRREADLPSRELLRFGGPLGTKRSHNRASFPHLAIGDGLQLFFE